MTHEIYIDANVPRVCGGVYVTFLRASIYIREEILILDTGFAANRRCDLNPRRDKKRDKLRDAL